MFQASYTLHVQNLLSSSASSPPTVHTRYCARAQRASKNQVMKERERAGHFHQPTGTTATLGPVPSDRSTVLCGGGSRARSRTALGTVHSVRGLGLHFFDPGAWRAGALASRQVMVSGTVPAQQPAGTGEHFPNEILAIPRELTQVRLERERPGRGVR